jgi:hypothetical protein
VETTVSIEIRVVDKQGHSGTSHLELKVAGAREATPRQVSIHHRASPAWINKSPLKRPF